MNGEFVTWDTLSTFAGVVGAVAIITQYFKQVPFIAKMNTQLLSYVVAIILLECAIAFKGDMSFANSVLCLVNAVFVALAANGMYDAMMTGQYKSIKEIPAKKEETLNG